MNDLELVGYPPFVTLERELKISVCMPVHKPDPVFIADAVHSIINNGYGNHELVMKDIEPNREQIIDALQEVDRINRGWQEANWLYQSGTDNGIFDALNQALRIANGDVFYFMCSDDLILPKFFEVVNQVFVGRSREPLWAYGVTVCGDEDGNEIARDGAPTTYEHLLLRNRIGQPAVVWNRRMMEEVGEFDATYKHAADYDYWLRCWKVRPPVFIDWPMGFFRKSNGQHSTMNREALAREAAKVSNKHIAAYRAANYEVKFWNP